MGFNKRILSESSIRSSAKSHKDSFHRFQRYMVYADAYIIEGKWASDIYHQFGQTDEDSEERRELHRKIANDEI